MKPVGDEQLDKFLSDPANKHWVRSLFDLKSEEVIQLYREKFGSDAPKHNLWYLLGRVGEPAKRHEVGGVGHMRGERL